LSLVSTRYPLPLKKSFSVFLSLRYLLPKRFFLLAITVLSTLGVSVGVTLLIVVIAIMTGFNIQMREAILGFEPHLVLKPEKGTIEDWWEEADEAREVPGVVDVAAMTQGQAVLDFNRRVWVVEMQGVEEPEVSSDVETQGIKTFSGQYDTLIGRGVGEFDLSDDNIVIGSTLARGMGINLGDTVSLLSLANGRELLDSMNNNREPEPERMIQPAELTVVGIYDSGRQNYDDRIVFVPMMIGQYLYDLGGGADCINVLVEDPYQINDVKERLTKTFEGRLEVDSWIDRNKKLFDAVALERMMMFFLLFMIVVVAAFCIMNTMITVTTQRRREIGLMKAVGAKTGQIVGAFLGQGIIVGFLGTALGLVNAFIILIYRQEIVAGLATIQGSNMNSAALAPLYDLPARITVLDIMQISGAAFLTCALASLLPAFFAARLDAARALRNETTI